MQPADSPVAVVLAGGGARGAYEIGALSALLPHLEARGERPRVIVGTSVGAINAAYLAASADEPIEEVLEHGLRLWSELGFDDVLQPLLSPAELARALGSVGEFLRVPGVRLPSLLDPSPLARTLRSRIQLGRIHTNVTRGALDAAAVVATSAGSGGSVVFHDGGGRVQQDRQRAIEYVPTRLGIDHVRASAAIPGVFPAVRVSRPRPAAGWYFDGGTRLNTPIKPALGLGAGRVVVIALNSLRSASVRGRPAALDGVSQLAQATWWTRSYMTCRRLPRSTRSCAHARCAPTRLVRAAECTGSFPTSSWRPSARRRSGRSRRASIASTTRS
jgi:NTE family protein